MYLSSWLPSDVITCPPVTNDDHHKPVLGTVYLYRAQHIAVHLGEQPGSVFSQRHTL